MIANTAAIPNNDRRIVSCKGRDEVLGELFLQKHFHKIMIFDTVDSPKLFFVTSSVSKLLWLMQPDRASRLCGLLGTDCRSVPWCPA